MKYKTKPETIEALKFDGPKSIDEMKKNWGSIFESYSMYSEMTNSLLLKTPSGTQQVRVGDMVVRSKKNEFTPCRKELFLQQFDPIDEAA